MTRSLHRLEKAPQGLHYPDRAGPAEDTTEAYRQANQVLEDQLNAAHITGEYPWGRLNLDGSIAGPKEAQMAVGFFRALLFFKYL